MRNLELIYKKSHHYDDIKVQLMVQNVYENISYVYDENNSIFKINHNSGDVDELCKYEGVNAMEFIQLNDSLCFTTTSGNIIQYSFNTGQCDVVS